MKKQLAGVMFNNSMIKLQSATFCPEICIVMQILKNI